MPIHASLVARGNVVLAECYPPTSNFPTVARGLIEKIPSTPDSKKSYSFDNYNFHYMVENKITYLCMTDSDMGLTVPYSFLFDVSAKFRGMYGDKALSASALAMNDSFGRILQERTSYFSNDRNANQITRIRGEIEDAKDIMVKNLDKVLERGSKIEMLVDKTENLQEHSQSFKRKATHLKRTMWWKNCKLGLMIAVILLIIVGTGVSIVCWKAGVFDHSGGGSGGGGNNNSTTCATTDTTTTTGVVTTGGTTTGESTPSSTPSSCPTPSSSTTPSPSPSSSATPSSSTTPSNTPSPSITPSSSVSPTTTPTITPSTTPTITASTQASPSSGTTPTPTSSPSSTPSIAPIDTTSMGFFI